MVYRGKRVIRMIGKIYGRQGGFVLLQYADRQTERINIQVIERRGRLYWRWLPVDERCHHVGEERADIKRAHQVRAYAPAGRNAKAAV